MNLEELKAKTPADLLAFAEELEIETGLRRPLIFRTPLLNRITE